MVTPALLAPTLPFVFAAGALGALAAWLLRWPVLAVAFLLFSLCAGQTLRVSLPGQGGGLLLSDFAVVGVLLSAFAHVALIKIGRPGIGSYNLQPTTYNLILLILPFILWSFFTLALNPLALSFADWLVAFAYWLRLSSYLLLLPALLLLLRDRHVRKLLVTGFPLVVIFLAGAGIAQVLLLPNLQVLGGAWDPHEGRLVSTWLDPNFFGAFLVLALPILLERATRKSAKRVLPRIAIAISLPALLLTQSRSSLIALVVAVVIMSPVFIGYFFSTQKRASWRTRLVSLIATCLIAASLLGLGVLLLGERAVGVVAFDANVQLRAAALSKVWLLAGDHWLSGVGYNAYQFAALREGLIGNFAIHSRAGADNSLLTLWVTTGIVGVVLFIVPWLAVFFLSPIRHAYQFPPMVALSVSLLAWCIHSQFVNSLLYGHLIITAAVVTALTIAETAVPPQHPVLRDPKHRVFSQHG